MSGNWRRHRPPARGRGAAPRLLGPLTPSPTASPSGGASQSALLDLLALTLLGSLAQLLTPAGTLYELVLAANGAATAGSLLPAEPSAIAAGGMSPRWRLTTGTLSPTGIAPTCYGRVLQRRPPLRPRRGCCSAGRRIRRTPTRRTLVCTVAMATLQFVGSELRRCLGSTARRWWGFPAPVIPIDRGGGSGASSRLRPTALLRGQRRQPTPARRRPPLPTRRSDLRRRRPDKRRGGAAAASRLAKRGLTAVLA